MPSFIKPAVNKTLQTLHIWMIKWYSWWHSWWVKWYSWWIKLYSWWVKWYSWWVKWYSWWVKWYYWWVKRYSWWVKCLVEERLISARGISLIFYLLVSSEHEDITDIERELQLLRVRRAVVDVVCHWEPLAHRCVCWHVKVDIEGNVLYFHCW